ncbi:MAG TPA: DUF6065 family protein, partial [Caulobacteraceae bacterium]
MGEQTPDLICYLHPGWAPLIRPAPATRAWMDATPEAFAYRCLPLNIANAHGWEVLNPHGFEAVWNGGTDTDAVSVMRDPGGTPERMAVSLFGQGIVTFHVEGILRTPPGWNLWVTGSPNRQKDAIAPLSAVVETDWSPFTFTMNWRFTRPHTPIRFEAMEPFCFVFPVQRAAIETFRPRLAPMADEPALRERFMDWSRGRDAFQERMRVEPPATPADRWQKHYYRGVDASGQALVEDHRAKLRLKGFDASAAPEVPKAPLDDVAVATPVAAQQPAEDAAPLRLALAKREWLLETLERQRALAPAAVGIERRAGLDAEEFLECYYAVNRPVILTGELADWPALSRWTPDYLKARLGDRPVEYQGGRAANARFEMEKDVHRRQAPFAAFMDEISRPGAGNDAYITAYNSERNAETLALLHEDMRPLGKFLDPDMRHPNGMMWIGPAGTATSLHYDLTNNLIAQVVGRKRLKILPAAEVGKLYNSRHVFSDIPDVEAPDLDLATHPRLAGARAYEVV